MDRERSRELSRKTEVSHLDGTRLDVILESKRGWLMRRPSKRSDLRGQSTKVVKLLLVGTMPEKRLVSVLWSSRESSRCHLGHDHYYMYCLVQLALTFTIPKSRRLGD